MNRELLCAVGEALYGPRWQTELARELEVSDRTIRRWLAGDVEPAPGVWIDLMLMTQERALALEDLSNRLRREAAT